VPNGVGQSGIAFCKELATNLIALHYGHQRVGCQWQNASSWLQERHFLVPLGTDNDCVVYAKQRGPDSTNILGGAVQPVETFIYANTPVLRFTTLGKTFSLIWEGAFYLLISLFAGTEYYNVLLLCILYLYMCILIFK